VFHENIAAVEALHGHNGVTRVVWTGYVDPEYVDQAVKKSAHPQLIHRDAKSGEFVTSDYADDNPDTTVKETNG
jgi:hypothetical protein